MPGALSAYAVASTALVGGVVYHTYNLRRQFFPTVRRRHASPTRCARRPRRRPPHVPPQVLALMASKTSLVVLCNEALMVTILLGHLLKRLFFGRLREAEVEHLHERSWYAITETCLAMTIFREEFNVRFVGLFTGLLFSKIFHWLVQDRIAFMEQTPAVSLRTHARMLTLMLGLFVLDACALHGAVSHTLTRGPSVMLLFGFEYLILTSSVSSTFGKYALHMNDVRLGGRWADKSVYLFYLELVTDLFHMVVYLAFFLLICTYYGLPLHIMRDLYLTCRSFKTRVTDFLRYRAITANMNERFPDATEEARSRRDLGAISARSRRDLGTGPQPRAATALLSARRLRRSSRPPTPCASSAASR